MVSRGSRGEKQRKTLKNKLKEVQKVCEIMRSESGEMMRKYGELPISIVKREKGEEEDEGENPFFS